MGNRETPQINAGSMADIAFLLLIFFLVTTTLNADIGILKKLSGNSQPPIIPVNQKNVLEININANNEIQIESSEIVDVEKIKQLVVNFIDNGAGKDIHGNGCDWCNGIKDLTSSDHPTKAIVTLQSSRNTSYGTYITIQNEINSAYNELRDRLSKSLYGVSFDKMLVDLKKNKNNTLLRERIDIIKQKYPLLISELEPVN
jgi:biopolymer transport protein ExbD